MRTSNKIVKKAAGSDSDYTLKQFHIFAI